MIPKKKAISLKMQMPQLSASWSRTWWPSCWKAKQCYWKQKKGIIWRQGTAGLWGNLEERNRIKKLNSSNPQIHMLSSFTTSLLTTYICTSVQTIAMGRFEQMSIPTRKGTNGSLKHDPKVQLGKPVSFLGVLTKHRQAVIHKNEGDLKTAIQ